MSRGKICSNDWIVRHFCWIGNKGLLSGFSQCIKMILNRMLTNLYQIFLKNYPKTDVVKHPVIVIFKKYTWCTMKAHLHQIMDESCIGLSQYDNMSILYRICYTFVTFVQNKIIYFVNNSVTKISKVSWFLTRLCYNIIKPKIDYIVIIYNGILF